MSEGSTRDYTKAGIFAAGAAAGIIFHLFARSKKLRSITVNALATGMKIRDDAHASLTSIKEDAEDIYAEAQQKRRAEAASDGKAKPAAKAVNDDAAAAVADAGIPA
ncbi:MAG: hypothetical protein LBP68_07855 [Acidobacteriota bacterium]|jgi:hypothetical protein|nr:hypothetical protein [Acidobacteriota bacterium]